MNKCIRKNLCVFLGGIISIFRCSDCHDCTHLAILPFKDTVESFSGNLFSAFLKSYFASIYHPIRKLDTFTVSARIRPVEFQISECEPGEGCSVTPNTEIHTEGEPLERRDDGNQRRIDPESRAAEDGGQPDPLNLLLSALRLEIE
jgi:transitional endoplasmic reticulum ATPase